MLDLLEAELKSLRHAVPSIEVKTAYDMAIRSARRSGFRMVVGVASERAAGYFLMKGEDHTALEYLKLSAAEFYDYGAHAKVHQMKEKYNNFLDRVTIEDLKSYGTSSSRMLGYVVETSDRSDLQLSLDRVAASTSLESHLDS